MKRLILILLVVAFVGYAFADKVVNPNSGMRDGLREQGDTCEDPLIAMIGDNFAPYAPLWYEYTATVVGEVTISSCVEGQLEDTRLYVYDACGGTQIAYSDDAYCDEFSYASEVTFAIQSGVSYYLNWVDTYSSDPFQWSVVEVEILAPEITDYSLVQSVDLIDWVPVVDEVVVDPIYDYTYLNIDEMTTSLPLMAGEMNEFFVETYPEGWFDYWAAKGVIEGAASWQAIMWEIINGNAPIMYLVFDGQGYMLVDGLQYLLQQGELNLRVSGDYLLGDYTYTGTVLGADGTPSEAIEIPLTFDEPFVPLQGDLCGDPIPLTLPAVDILGTSDGFMNDYSFTGSSYMNGIDIVYEMTIDVDGGFLQGSLVTDGYGYPGLFILDGCPDGEYNTIYNGGASQSLAFEGVAIDAGTYYVVVSNWPSPYDFTYTLNMEWYEWIPDPGEVCATAIPYYNINDPAQVGATVEAGDAVWYEFYLDGTYEDVTVSLLNSNFDTKLEVWADCDDATYIGYNDDWYGRGALIQDDIRDKTQSRVAQSQIVFDELEAGNYFAKVYGYGSYFGDYELNITGTLPIPQGDLCGDPIPLTLPVVDLYGTSDGFMNDYTYPGSSYMNGIDIVYEMTVDVDGGYLQGSLVTPGYGYPGLFILDACPDGEYNTIYYGGASQSLAFEGIAVDAGTYYVIISNWPTPDFFEYTLNLEWYEWTPDPGEVCYSAIPYYNINDPAQTGATLEAGDAVWYEFYLDETYFDVTVSLLGSDFDTKLEVWADCDDATYIGYNDDWYGRGAVIQDDIRDKTQSRVVQSQIVFDELEAGNYYAKVFGYGSSFGNYELVVTGNNFAVPEIIDYSLVSSIDAVNWLPVTGNVYIDPAYDYTYLDINEMTTNTPLMTGEMNEFFVATYPVGWFDYWAAKGVIEGATDWQGVMWEIINGNAPIMYLVYDGSGYMLVDGLLYQIQQGEMNLRVSGDYLLGDYTYTGTVLSSDGLVSEDISIPLTFAAPPLQGEACDFAFPCEMNGDPQTGSIISYQHVWYEFTIDQLYQDVAVSLCGSSFDTKLYVYAECGASYIGYNDDYCGVQSQINFATLEAGTYYVDVLGYSSAYGDYELVVSGTIPPTGETCELAFPYYMINDPAQVGTTTVAGEFVWYEFYLDSTYFNVTVSLLNSEFDTMLEVWGDCDDDTYLAYNDDWYGRGALIQQENIDKTQSRVVQSQIVFDELEAGNYYAKVMGYGSNYGDYELEITGDFQILPEIESYSLVSSTDMVTWLPVMNDVVEIDPLFDYTYLNLADLTTNIPILVNEMNEFFVESYPEGWFDYWAGKGVIEGATSWQAIMWEIINGNAPIMYIVDDGRGTMLVDGLLYQLGEGMQNLRVSGDYLLGDYTYTGTILSDSGLTSELITIPLTFAEPWVAPPGWDCATPYVIDALPFMEVGMTTEGFGDNYSSANTCTSSYMNGDDFVFEYIPTEDIIVDITLTNTLTWVGVFITQGCPDDPAAVCIDYATSSSGNPMLTGALLTMGETYYIIISTYPSPQFTAFDIEINGFAPGSTCELAINYGEINDPPQTGVIESYEEAWYTFTIADAHENVGISLLNSDFDTILELWSDCDGELLAYNDDWSRSSVGNGPLSPKEKELARVSQSYIPYAYLMAGTYYVKVYGYMSSAGNYELEITGDLVIASEVEGYVYDSATQLPLEGALVHPGISGFETYTDENGYYHIVNLPTGDYDFAVSLQYYVTIVEPLTVVEGLNNFDFYLDLADYIEIGTGTSLTSYVPVYGFYDYSWSGTVYLQEELGEAMTINKIAYFVGNTCTDYIMPEQYIYMTHTAEDIITDNTYQNPAGVRDFQEVFSGTITFNSGWLEIILDNTFDYNGVDNLMIWWDNFDGDYASGYPRFNYTPQTSRAIYKYSDNTFPAALTGTIASYLPNIRIYSGSAVQPGETVENAIPVEFDEFNYYHDSGDLSLYTDDYDMPAGTGGADVVYALNLGMDAMVDVSLLASDYDTQLAIYSSDVIPGGDNYLYYNDDYSGRFGGNELIDWARPVIVNKENSRVSESALYDMPLTAGMYYIVVDAWSTETGIWDIEVTWSDACQALECVGTPEGEEMILEGGADVTNGGCNMAEPLFSAIAPGETVCGMLNNYITATGGNSRDMDWYLSNTGDDFEYYEVTVTVDCDFGDAALWITNGLCGEELAVYGFYNETGYCSYEQGVIQMAAGDFGLIVSTPDYTGYPDGFNYALNVEVAEYIPPEDVFINVQVDSWPSEATWNVYDYQTLSFMYVDDMTFASSGEMQNLALILEPGMYSVVCYDTYGDGGIAGNVVHLMQTLVSWASGDYTTEGWFDFEVGGGMVYGDVDGNGAVEAFDTSNLLQYVVGLDPDAVPLPWGEETIAAADVDGNFWINAYDGALILQYVVGYIDVFPVELMVRHEAPEAIVNVEFIDNELIFTANGELYSFEAAVSSTLGTPDTEIMYALNGNKIALASAEPITGEFLRIPVSADVITIDIVFNNSTERIELTNVPSVTALMNNYPNPFNPVTTIAYEVAETGNVLIQIYNIKGQLVTTLINEQQDPGSYKLQWNADGQASGVYFFKMKFGRYTSTKKMILMK
ncbi:MAG: T9SS type A sorting domain-containing protein [Candidatus Cloacimonetes bacterium]|nr:T9SS type A sorting domain-containing protein [Candidatus Cloacimonadota bacterium]